MTTAPSIPTNKVALILGIGGQDGSYLAEHLLGLGYDVHGLYRRSSVDNLVRIRHIRDRVTLHKGDLLEPDSVREALYACLPTEVYNLADQDHVGWSHVLPNYSTKVTYGGATSVLDLCLEMDKQIRVFQPLTALMFGGNTPPQHEGTPIDPQSPYAIAKSALWLTCRYYREAKGLFVSCGILFNHDSPRRSGEYLLHEIAKQAVLVSKGKREKIRVGDPFMQVDVGHAKEFVTAFHRMLQLEAPGDYVVGTGVAFPIHVIASVALNQATGRPTSTNVLDFIEADKSLLRPGKQPNLRAMITAKNRKALQWTHTLDSLAVVRELVEHYGPEVS